MTDKSSMYRVYWAGFRRGYVEFASYEDALAGAMRCIDCSIDEALSAESGYCFDEADEDLAIVKDGEILKSAYFRRTGEEPPEDSCYDYCVELVLLDGANGEYWGEGKSGWRGIK